MTTVSTDIAAPVERVWALVSDLTRMGEWSPETQRVEWLDGATEAAVGVRFKGHNQAGVRRWSTTGTITVADPPSTLAWDVTSVGGLAVAQWRYEIERITDTSCRVTESTTDRRGLLMKVLGNLATGVKDRGDHNAEGMRVTLERLKLAAESPT